MLLTPAGEPHLWLARLLRVGCFSPQRFLSIAHFPTRHCASDRMETPWTTKPIHSVDINVLALVSIAAASEQTGGETNPMLKHHPMAAEFSDMRDNTKMEYCSGLKHILRAVGCRWVCLRGA